MTAVTITRLGLCTLLLATASAAGAETPNENGTALETGRVQLPLEEYNRLVQLSRERTRAPSGYAVGLAEIDLRVREAEGRASGAVTAKLEIRILEDEWVLVPILPAGTPVRSVTIEGKPVQLIRVPDGLAWGSNTSGVYTMELVYDVDALRSGAGYVLPLPTPEAAATRLTVELPGVGLSVAVIPAAAVHTTSAEGTTHVAATLPSSRGVQISWRTPVVERHTISRASYTGSLVGEEISWVGELGVEISGDETVSLPLLPSDVTLNDVEVDGQKASIAVVDGAFATLVQGRGSHRVVVAFQVPVEREGGPPGVSLRVPEIPVSRFELTLPGRKELSVTPGSDVKHRVGPKATVATFHVPMTREVSLTWTEAIPEDLRAETRAHASLYHAVHAEEGVLYVDATVVVEVTRGEVSQVELELPTNVQVNRIHSESGGISDWRVTPGQAGAPQRVTVFLDHALQGEVVLYVEYDRSLVDDSGEIPIPLLAARGVQRQRGMIALLATQEVTLMPVLEDNVTRVGENQLPAFFLRRLENAVAHTFKYAESAPRLAATPKTPERVQAKFDAEVNTLVSLTDVTLKGSASVNVNVKSGRLSELRLAMPRDVNLLSLTAPSLRTQRMTEEAGRSVVEVEFTQDMEGQLRIEVAYERITTDGESELSVPTLNVLGAEVEQGQIAVEALSAVEVRVAAAEQLSSLDPAELPQQMILKTTNPILLAYKYVHVDPPFALALRVTRHREVAVQSAAIDRADYRTLFTRDGLAVTTARFTVRNSRKQFLRVRLPEGAEVWSAAVGGKPEKPAIADSNGSNGHAPEILIKVLNSLEGFPVELIYTTPTSEFGRFGRIAGHLPRPDMVVTRSHWDVFLPDRYTYGTPTTNMDVVVNQQPMSRASVEQEFEAVRAPQPTQTPVIEVPIAGVHYAFEKLYANQAEDEAAFSIPYASTFGATLGQALALLGTALFWSGIALALRGAPLDRRASLGLAALGVVVLWIPLGYLQTNPLPPLLLSLFALIGGVGFATRERWQTLGGGPRQS